MSKKNTATKVKYKAVENGLFNVEQLNSIIENLETDLQELFSILENFNGLDLKKKLKNIKREYERRNSILNNESRITFSYLFDKLIDFIDEKIEKLNITLKEEAIQEKKINKANSITTHYEIGIALYYIAMNANNRIELDKTKIIALMYYLRKENQPARIADTSEYKQLIDVFQNEKNKRKSMLKKHGSNVIAFLNNIGLLDVATLIEKDING